MSMSGVTLQSSWGSVDAYQIFVRSKAKPGSTGSPEMAVGSPRISTDSLG